MSSTPKPRSIFLERPSAPLLSCATHRTPYGYIGHCVQCVREMMRKTMNAMLRKVHANGR